MKTTGLTLKEAVESGRPFRHKGWGIWHTKATFHETFFKQYVGGKLQSPSYNDGPLELKELFSSDWEIKSKDTFTREDVERALDKYAEVAKRYGVHNTHHAKEEAMAAAEQEQ